jgi:radical SAM protein with 4Fe4S-binding SPASM domain
VVLSGLSRLIISIDGTTQEVYEHYRKGGELDKVLKGTAEVIAWKKRLGSATPHIIFQFLVVKPNQHQIPEVKRLAKNMGVDELRFKTAQVYDFENGNHLIPDIPRYSRYKQNNQGTWEIKNALDNHCWKMWHSCVITQNGEVVPCCFDKNASKSLGNIASHGLKVVWQGEKYRAFRAAILRSRKEIDICRNCSEGTRVWA